MSVGHRTPPAPRATRVDPELIPDCDLRDEWTHFAGFGWTDERVAKTLHVDLQTIRTTIKRHLKDPS